MADPHSCHPGSIISDSPAFQSSELFPVDLGAADRDVDALGQELLRNFGKGSLVRSPGQGLLCSCRRIASVGRAMSCWPLKILE
jgi:hypothetical protein